jgi:hypothetical protein
VKLVDLEALFLRREVREDGVFHHAVQSLAEADGVRFLCPLCFKVNGGRVGTHSVICWFEDRVPDDAQPGPGRWKPQGIGLEDLTFVVGKRSNSVLLIGGCAWHGFITNGEAR